MNTQGKRGAACAAGRLVIPIALALTVVPPPEAHAVARIHEQVPVADPRHLSCGEPAASSAPAMVVCDSGGDGAISCETKHTISVGGIGTVSGCGISCTEGWYACCQDPTLTKRATCTCRQDQPRGPWTPESPW